MTQEQILKSSDFLVLINLITCGAYEINVQKDTILNNMLPNIITPPSYY